MSNTSINQNTKECNNQFEYGWEALRPTHPPTSMSQDLRLEADAVWKESARVADFDIALSQVLAEKAKWLEVAAWQEEEREADHACIIADPLLVVSMGDEMGIEADAFEGMP